MNRRNRSGIGDESGQVLILAAVLLVLLIALTGFAVDVGRAYLVQRQLQAATDAAALAGALDLPDSAQAKLTAVEYGPQPGKRNPPHSNDNAAFAPGFPETKCVVAIDTGCTPGNGVNSIEVRSTSVVQTVFAKVIGVDSFTVKARATACSPCSVKPLDIMLVLDRTGSMCQITDPRNPSRVIADPQQNVIDPSTGRPYGNPKGCTDLVNAKNGVTTFLSKMNPRYHHVGLAVFPPVNDASTEAGRCGVPNGDTTYNNRNADYTLVGLSSDYAVSQGNLNAGSSLMRTVDCLPSAGRTAYADAIDSARTELAGGRAGVQKVIVFVSDGAANYGGTWHPANSPYRTDPCRQGITSSNLAKAAGTIVYAIGYDLDGGGNAPEQCVPGTITSFAALGGASGPPTFTPGISSSYDTFYNKPDPGQLNTIFTAIAADIFRTAQLIDDSLQ